MVECLTQAYTKMLATLEENINFSTSKDTPTRATKAFCHLTQGYKLQLEDIVNGALFPTTNNDLIIVKDIELISLCEHHLLPFIGKCHVGYIPNGKILGLSKIARIVDMFARRLQLQENLNQQIAKAILEVTNAIGVGIIIEAKHLCMMARGIKKQNATVKTSSMLGSFKNDDGVQKKFFRLLETKTKPTFTQLKLKNFKFDINLGCSTQERATPQPVFLDLIIRFPISPEAINSDNLEETICYEKLTKAISKFCQNKEFHLIEYLVKQLYDFLKDYLKNETKILLHIKKTKPLEDLEFGIFTIGDFSEENV